MKDKTKQGVGVLVATWLIVISLYLVILIQTGASLAKMVAVVGFVPVGAFSIALYIAAKKRREKQ